jgi:hypothetical protein
VVGSPRAKPFDVYKKTTGANPKPHPAFQKL